MDLTLTLLVGTCELKKTAWDKCGTFELGEAQ